MTTIGSDTVNAVNFAGLIFRVWQHKNIRGLLNSRWANAHFIFLYCTNTWHHSKKHLQATGQHKNKAGLTFSNIYITHLHQHTWSIHNSYVSKMYSSHIKMHSKLRCAGKLFTGVLPFCLRLWGGYHKPGWLWKSEEKSMVYWFYSIIS